MSPSVSGFRAAGVCCGIKPSGKLDLALIHSEVPAAAAGVFTTSQFPGAPVVVSRRRMRSGRAQTIVVNSGVSNVAMGTQGLRDAREMSALAASATGATPPLVQVSSTGVIGVALPMEKIRVGVAEAAAKLSPTGWAKASRAILTTDTKPKLVHVKVAGGSILGIAKGAGMIMPDMATMLVYLATDLPAEPAFLDRALRNAVEPSLNSLTIDGETSTSDTTLILANGCAGGPLLTAESQTPRARDFTSALADVCSALASKLAEDGEGVTRLAEIAVTGARTDRAAKLVARKVANSVLFKTALFGTDPNWGRIVQAIGAAGVKLQPKNVAITIGGVPMLRGGEPVPGNLTRAERAMKKKRVKIDISLGPGPGRAQMLTTDLTYEYVRINADYTT